MMFPVDPWVLLAFVPAGLALNLTPGADMMFTLAQGLRGGPNKWRNRRVDRSLGFGHRRADRRSAA